MPQFPLPSQLSDQSERWKSRVINVFRRRHANLKRAEKGFLPEILTLHLSLRDLHCNCYDTAKSRNFCPQIPDGHWPFVSRILFWPADHCHRSPPITRTLLTDIVLTHMGFRLEIVDLHLCQKALHCYCYVMPMSFNFCPKILDKHWHFVSWILFWTDGDCHHSHFITHTFLAGAELHDGQPETTFCCFLCWCQPHSAYVNLLKEVQILCITLEKKVN